MEPPSPYPLPVPQAYINGKIRESQINTWNKRWCSRTDCRQTKEFFPRVEPGMAKKLMQMSRQGLGTLIQLCTGHNYLNYHQNLVHKDPADDLCRLCLEDTEDSWHILMECPALGSIRQQVFGYEIFIRTVHYPVWDPRKFLTLLRGSPMDLLIPRGVRATIGL